MYNMGEILVKHKNAPDRFVITIKSSN